MADALAVQHRGYTIRFNENADEWSCLDAGDYSSPSLSKVRAHIDKMLLAMRKAEAVTAYEIGSGSYSTPSKVEAKIIEYVKSKEETDYRGKPTGKTTHTVATVAARPGNERASRREVSLNGLMPDTPEAHAAYDAYIETYRLEQIAKKASAAAFAAIPRMTIDMIQPLVRLAEGGKD